MALPFPVRSLLQRLGSHLRPARGPRQARLYCVGGPRTGTHSVAAIFDRTVRSRHEADFRASTDLVVGHHEGRVTFDELRAFVRRRDERLRLDVDSSHVHMFLIDAIRAEFEDARFLLTIRDCYTWVDSALNHTLSSRKWSAADRRYLEFYFDAANLTWSPHDAFLRDLGLLSIDCYLAAWSRHNATALANAPADRLLVVRTDEISRRLADIATFAGLPAERIVPGFRARGTARASHDVLRRVDPAFLADRVAAHCAPLMERYFPGIRSLADARAARRDV